MSDSFIVEKLKKPGLRLVWSNHIGNSSPPEATSLGVTLGRVGDLRRYFRIQLYA